MSLTDKACKNAKPTGKPYKLADSQGLYLQVMPSGSKYWRWKYRFVGKEKCLALGVYPEVSLLAAREKKAANRKLLADLKDPSSRRRELKQAAVVSASTTFELVAREWHAHNKEKWSEQHGKYLLHRMEVNVFPELGRFPIADIKAIQVLKAMQKIEDRGAHDVAKRCLQYCGQIFRYAVITERAERDPTTDLKRVLRPGKKGHFASIEADELPDFLNALSRNDARLFIQTRRAIELLMLTFVRTSELIGAKWAEFDLDGKQWLIPAERMKMKRAHIVPLSNQSCHLLKEQHELTGKWDWVFPNQARPRQHMSNMTILKALERMGYKGRMTGHGFRALAMSTIKEKLGYRHEVIDRQLAHAHKNQIDAAYDRAMFLSDRRRMMQEWADYINHAKGN
jgi:integrase